ncbi:MAG: restriction endonuclease subunit S [Mycoplasma sp.]
MAEVKLVKIKDICEIKRGSGNTKKYIENNPGPYPVYSSQTSNNGCIGHINTYSFDGEYVSWTTDGIYAGTVFYRNEKFNISQHCALLKNVRPDILNTRYLYFICGFIFKNYVNTSAVIESLTLSVVGNIEIPLPPLDIQNQIVGILDQLSSYTAELSAELDARSSQYKYCSQKINDFSDENHILGKFDYEIKKVGELCKLVPVKIVPKKQLSPGKYPLISGGVKPSFYCSTFNTDGKYFTISKSGSAGYISFWNEPSFVNDALVYKTTNPEKVNIKFIYYYLKSIQEDVYKLTRGAVVKHVYASDINNINIPLPSIDIQNQIVGILDQFDTMIKNIENGLPRLIELNEKRYKYYLNKLLTFGGQYE